MHKSKYSNKKLSKKSTWYQKKKKQADSKTGRLTNYIERNLFFIKSYHQAVPLRFLLLLAQCLTFHLWIPLWVRVVCLSLDPNCSTAPNRSLHWSPASRRADYQGSSSHFLHQVQGVVSDRSSLMWFAVWGCMGRCYCYHHQIESWCHLE